MVAQARLIEAYERSRWPQHAPTLPDLLTYLIDHDCCAFRPWRTLVPAMTDSLGA